MFQLLFWAWHGFHGFCNWKATDVKTKKKRQMVEEPSETTLWKTYRHSGWVYSLIHPNDGCHIPKKSTHRLSTTVILSTVFWGSCQKLCQVAYYHPIDSRYRSYTRYIYLPNRLGESSRHPMKPLGGEFHRESFESRTGCHFVWHQHFLQPSEVSQMGSGWRRLLVLAPAGWLVFQWPCLGKFVGLFLTKKKVQCLSKWILLIEIVSLLKCNYSSLMFFFGSIDGNLFIFRLTMWFWFVKMTCYFLLLGIHGRWSPFRRLTT